MFPKSLASPSKKLTAALAVVVVGGSVAACEQAKPAPLILAAQAAPVPTPAPVAAEATGLFELAPSYNQQLLATETLFTVTQELAQDTTQVKAAAEAKKQAAAAQAAKRVAAKQAAVKKAAAARLKTAKQAEARKAAAKAAAKRQAARAAAKRAAQAKAAEARKAALKRAAAQAKAKRLASGCYASGSAQGLQLWPQQVRTRIYKQFSPKSIGGYRAEAGSDHGTGEALDVMVPVGSAKGDAVAQWAISHHKQLNIKYVIWKQHIWAPYRQYWRPMSDRGGVTANHYDHVHISFKPGSGTCPSS